MSHEQMLNAPRVLVVEAEPLLRQALIELLSEEGYATSDAASLDEALAAVEETAFAFILADLIVGKSRHSFTPAHILRRHARSIPLGILTNEAVSPWDERWSAFAFTLSKPIETARLLTEVAACLNIPLSPVQMRQAEVLRRFVEAIAPKHWSRLLNLCTEDVRYSPPEAVPTFNANPLQGHRAIQAYISSVWQSASRLRLEVLGIYSRPKGLALRYLRFAPTPDYGWAWQEQTEVFQLVGDRITQIGVSDFKRPLPQLEQQPQVG